MKTAAIASDKEKQSPGWLGRPFSTLRTLVNGPHYRTKIEERVEIVTGPINPDFTSGVSLVKGS